MELPLLTRQIGRMFALVGQDTAVIAQIVGQPESAVYNRLITWREEMRAKRIKPFHLDRSAYPGLRQKGDPK